MSTSIFFDPPILARRVYAGEVRVVDDIKFWNKITKVVYSRIHSEDNNLNFEVKDATKEINFYTNQITFHDGDGDQLGYIDSTGTIHGLTIDGHATDGDFGDLEDRVDVLETDMTSNASRISVVETDLGVVETDLASNASRISVLETDLGVVETDLASNASRISVVETDLASNASRISVLETDLGVVETDLASNASRISVLETDLGVVETDLASNASRIDVVETDLASNASRISVVETDLGVVETDLSSNASRISVVETDLASNASRVEVLETDLSSNASRISVVETDLSSNAGRVSALETFADNNETRIEVLETDLTERTLRIEDLEDDMTSNASRLTTVENSYATTSYVNSAVVTSSAISLLIDAALASYATAAELSATTQNLTDLSDAVVDTYVPYPLDWVTYTSLGNSLSNYVDGKIGEYSDIVRKPSDWLSYRPTPGSDTTLKSYTEKKILEDINNLLDGGYDHLQLRNDAINLNGDRVGTQLIDFLRTTASESFGANECADWRLTTNSTCGFDLYRKATHPTLGSLYDGNVIEFKADGDVNIPKAGGLFIDDDDVATITDVTDRTDPLDYSVSQLVTTTNDHSNRITTLEGAGYVTQTNLNSTLSTYALQSSLGTTNTTVGNIDTRLTTVENAGYVTASGLSGYNFATEGYVQSNLPTATDILTTTSVTASASSGSTAGVAVTSTTNGVNLAFTIPPGADGADGTDGTTPTIDVGATTTGGAGTNASVSASTSGTTTTFSFTIPKGDTGATGAGLNSSGVLDISKDGEVAKFQPATSGNHTIINFNSKVNSGSDKGFILVQDESAEPGGSSTEDLRMTVGVYNDFRTSTAHSDELWFQGGGRLCYNVGSWDNELNTIIGTPSAGTALGGLKHEWRINNSAMMTLDSSGNLGINKTAPGYKLHVGGNSRFEGEMMWRNAEITSHAHSGTNEDWYIRSGKSGGKVILQDTGGRVGIGQANPICKLDVEGAIHLRAENLGNALYTSPDASNMTNTYIAFGYAGSSNDWAFLRQIGGSNSYDLALDFHDDGGDAGFVIRDVQSTANPDAITTRFRVARGGNVGIGEPNPSQKLEVAGNIKLSGSGRQIYLNNDGAGLYWGSGYSRIVDDGNLRICTDDTLHFYTGCNSSSLGTERITILENGSVGIGTNAPDATLDVNGYVNTVGFICNDYVGYFYKGLRIYGVETTQDYDNFSKAYTSSGIDNDPNNLSFSLYAQYSVRAGTYVAFSDSRIKSNVVDISDTTALDQLRQLQPKYYEYVDKVARGSSTVIGFIAQEVKEVVPQAVSVADGDIPNIYQTANVSANTITFTNFHTSNLDATSNTLVIYEGGTKREELTILEVVDEHTIRVDTDIAGEDVFVYGQVVQDFHHLNKDYLWTIATSALQEVDRQLQAEKARNDSLEARLTALETALGIS